jgi:hypothetical protein
MMEMLSPQTVKQWLDLGVTVLLAGYLIVRQDRLLQEIRLLLKELLYRDRHETEEIRNEDSRNHPRKQDS